MLNLALTTDKLGLITSSTADIDVHVSYVNDLTDTMTPGKQNTAIASAVASPGTDIKAAPASGIDNVKFISARNKHASTSNDITFIFNANATIYTLFKCTLLAGESVVCREGIWFHYDTNGGVYGQSLPVASDTVVGGIGVATQANMEAATSLVLAVSPGRIKYDPGNAKAWCKSTGATGARVNAASNNVSSLTDTAIGDITFNWTTAFSASTYAISLTSEWVTSGSGTATNDRKLSVRTAGQATGSARCVCWDSTTITNAAKDPQAWHIVAFGDFA